MRSAAAMRKYAVKLHGRNVLVEVRGHKVKHGFLQVRSTEAANKQRAAEVALSACRAQLALQEEVITDSAEEPVIEVVGIALLESFHGHPPATGFLFYPENPADARLYPGEYNVRVKSRAKRRIKVRRESSASKR